MVFTSDTQTASCRNLKLSRSCTDEAGPRVLLATGHCLPGLVSARGWTESLAHSMRLAVPQLISAAVPSSCSEQSGVTLLLFKDIISLVIDNRILIGIDKVFSHLKGSIKLIYFSLNMILTCSAYPIFFCNLLIQTLIESL